MTDSMRVIEDTRRWLDKAVIGLNLCPFARAVHVKQQIHYAVSHASEWSGVLEDLERELTELANAKPSQRETTLLMLPDALADFIEFNGFLAQAERTVASLDLQGTIQLASFHPHYQFAGSEPDDPANFSNRAPYPTLHLLREASIEHAVQAFSQPQSIYEANIQTLRKLGREGWQALGVERT